MSKTDRAIQGEVIKRVINERDRQDRLYGNEDLSANPHLWLRILVEEVGEVAHDIDHGGNLKEELTQVAATAVGWLEDIQHEETRRG